MKNITCKGLTIETDTQGNSYIYKDGELKGCTHTDDNKNNSEQKAKLRIDSGKLNLLNS